MSLVIYGDFDHCGYSRAAKDEGESWKRRTKGKLQLTNIPISTLFAFKNTGVDSRGTFTTILKKIRRKQVNLTLPIIFYKGTWVPKGYEGMKAALNKKKAVSKKTNKRRGRSRSRSRSKQRLRKESNLR